MCKALGSNPCTKKKEKRKGGRKEARKEEGLLPVGISIICGNLPTLREN
jgi:hypothetical protein